MPIFRTSVCPACKSDNISGRTVRTMEPGPGDVGPDGSRAITSFSCGECSTSFDLEAIGVIETYKYPKDRELDRLDHFVLAAMNGGLTTDALKHAKEVIKQIDLDGESDD